MDRTLLTVARAFGARPWQLYVKVILPAIVPTVLAAMRLGLVFCLLGVLIVEMFAGVRGMGDLMASVANAFQAPELFAATALVPAASIAIVLALDALNEKLSRWRNREFEQQSTSQGRLLLELSHRLAGRTDNVGGTSVASRVAGDCGALPSLSKRLPAPSR